MNEDLKVFKKICKTYLTDDVIDLISKALTEYAFRSGPIEDIHSDDYGGSRITQSEMKQLNKYMVNQLASILKALAKGMMDEVCYSLSWNRMLASDWDKPEIDLKTFKYIKKFLNKGNKCKTN